MHGIAHEIRAADSSSVRRRRSIARLDPGARPGSPARHGRGAVRAVPGRVVHGGGPFLAPNRRSPSRSDDGHDRATRAAVRRDPATLARDVRVRRSDPRRRAAPVRDQQRGTRDAQWMAACGLQPLRSRGRLAQLPAERRQCAAGARRAIRRNAAWLRRARSAHARGLLRARPDRDDDADGGPVHRARADDRRCPARRAARRRTHRRPSSLRRRQRAPAMARSIRRRRAP